MTHMLQKFSGDIYAGLKLHNELIFTVNIWYEF